MTHDLLCRREGVTEALMGGCPECNLIAKARDNAIAAAVQRVEAEVATYGIAMDAPVMVVIIAAIKGES